MPTDAVGPNLFANSQVLVDANADTIPDSGGPPAGSFAAAKTGTGTFSLGTDTGVRYWRGAWTGGQSGQLRWGVTVDTTNVAVGDRLAWSGQFRTAGCAAGAATWKIEASDGSGALYFAGPTGSMTSVDFLNWTTFYTEVIVPTGASFMFFKAIWSAGAGQIDIREGWRLINLTKLGFA
jgi:hypothetical protein